MDRDVQSYVLSSGGSGQYGVLLGVRKLGQWVMHDATFM